MTAVCSATNAVVPVVWIRVNEADVAVAAVLHVVVIVVRTVVKIPVIPDAMLENPVVAAV